MNNTDSRHHERNILFNKESWFNRLDEASKSHKVQSLAHVRSLLTSEENVFVLMSAARRMFF